MLSNAYLINSASKCIACFYNNECVIICLYILVTSLFLFCKLALKLCMKLKDLLRIILI
jgi:hypothetical protein